MIRIKTRVRVIADTDADPHDIFTGMEGDVIDRTDGKPHDGNAPVWREDGSPAYQVEFDNGQVQWVWPEEIERAT